MEEWHINNILKCNVDIISEVLNHILISVKKRTLHIIGGETEVLDDIFSTIQIKKNVTVDRITEGEIYFVVVKNDEELESLTYAISKFKKEADFVIYNQSDNAKSYDDILGMGHPLLNNAKGRIYFFGRHLSWNNWNINNEFKVIAIIHCYNEGDIIEQTINYVLNQGLDVYLVDNWSTDVTYEIIEEYSKKYPNRIMSERFPKEGKSDYCDLYHQLERTEQIQKELDYNWYVHYDADEMRISPWENVTLKEMIYQADLLGYNTIDNTVIDFKLTDEYIDNNIFMQDVFYDFGHRTTHFRQRKTWKKCDELELKSSGGHIAVVPGNNTYPLKILNRHYPLRSVYQAQNKVFRDRKPRFIKEQKARGWHGHYSNINNMDDIIMDSSKLLCWNNDTFNNMYIPFFFGCGIIVYDERVLIPKLDFKDKRIVIYGAGEIGEWLYRKYVKNNIIVAWIDRNSADIKEKLLCTIDEPEIIKNVLFDYCVVAVKNTDFQKEIIEQLEALGVDKTKIICYEDAVDR